MTTQRQLQQKDFQYLWHPFTQTSVWRDVDPLVIERGEGVYLFDVDGRRYLDGVSALWCNVHGHGVPELVAAIQQQAALLCHSTLLGLTHRPIIELSEALAQHQPTGLQRFFFSDSGTAAVEASLRMAVEYWQNVGGDAAKRRRHFASLEDAYHGDTLGAIGVGFSPTFHSKLSSVVVPSLQFATPGGMVARGIAPDVALDAAVDGAKKLFVEHGETLTAFIVEPLVQGAAGIRPYPKEFLQEIAALCRHYGVLLIADEVATGFGKLGTMFACQQAGVVPDLLVMGKGLTAGYLPMSAVAVSERVFEAFTGAIEEGKTFFFGQTFAGNPLAARVALESLRLFESTDLLAQLSVRLETFAQLLERDISSLRCVSQVRRAGVMTAIELAPRGESIGHTSLRQASLRVVAAARKRGVIIRPLGSAMVLMPPLVMQEAQLRELVSATAEAIAEVLV